MPKPKDICICGEYQAEHRAGGTGCPAFDDAVQYLTGEFDPLTDEQLKAG